jgi:broad specificity phosphatase PhoE
VTTLVALVRHAQPAVDGTKDPGLGQLGRLQAGAAAARLCLERPAGLYASHLRRARETAEVIGSSCELEVEIDEDLREWESYVAQPFYQPPEALDGSPRRIAFAEGRYDDFVPDHDHAGLQARMAEAMRRIAGKHPDGLVVVVSHGGAINALLARVVATDRKFFFDPAYAGISRLRVMDDDRLVLASINETEHLALTARPLGNL